MNWTIVAPIMTAIASLLGAYLSNRKSAALFEYRLEQLEKKVDQHNSLGDRLTKVETQIADMKKGA